MEAEQIESRLPEWAFVEVMGHAKICGRLSAVKMGMAVMLQVDVLKADNSGVAFSKMFSPASLFSITPVTREYCLGYALQRERFEAAPVPYIAPPSRQITSGEPDDFFEWCAARGYHDIAEHQSEALPGRLQEALELYSLRHDRDDLKKEYADELENEGGEL